MDVLKARAKAKAGKQKTPEAEKPAVEAPASVSAPVPPPAVAPATAAPKPATETKSVPKDTSVPEKAPPPKPVPAAEPASKAAAKPVAASPAEPAASKSMEPEHGLDLPVLPPEEDDDEPADEPGSGPNEEEQFLHSYAAQAGRQADSLKYLTFDVGGECYGLLLTDVRETIKLPQITEVPRSPTYLKGLISLRGTMVPIVDLRHRLLLTAPELTRHSRIVICEHEAALVGFVVDRVLKVVDVSEGDIQAPPATLSPEEQEVIEGIGRFRTGIVQAETVTGETDEDAIIPEHNRVTVEFFTLLKIPTLARIEFRGAAR